MQKLVDSEVATICFDLFWLVHKLTFERARTPMRHRFRIWLPRHGLFTKLIIYSLWDICGVHGLIRHLRGNRCQLVHFGSSIFVGVRVCSQNIVESAYRGWSRTQVVVFMVDWAQLPRNYNMRIITDAYHRVWLTLRLVFLTATQV